MRKKKSSTCQRHLLSSKPLGMADSNATNGNGHTISRLSDEETPLLRDQTKHINSVVGDVDTNESEEQVVFVDEISSKRLFLVLGSVYVGVFLGALGKYFLHVVPPDSMAQY